MRLFHISSSNLNGKTLTPKVPDNILTKMGIENNTIPRVSFAPDVKHAILAIGYNRIKTGPKILNVYEPENYRTIKLRHSDYLTANGYVPDADETLETWILNSIKLKYAGKIKIIKPTKEFVRIKLPGNQEIKNYYWEYKVLDGDIE
jgi:hypothetical protein